MGLIEIIRGLETDDATYEASRAFAEELGKTVIESKDMPGFLVNRMLGPFINEAIFALMESTGTRRGHRHRRQAGPEPPDGPAGAERLHRQRRHAQRHGRPAPRLRRSEVPRRAAAAPDGRGRPPRPEDRSRLLPVRRAGHEDRLDDGRARTDPRPVRPQRRGAQRSRHGPRLGTARDRAGRGAARRGGALRPLPVRARRRARPDRACRIPRSYGGAGMGTFAWALALEEIAAADMGMAVSLSVHYPQPALHLHQRDR